MAYLSLSRREILAIEGAIETISSLLIGKLDQHAVPIFHPIIPDEPELGDVVDPGAAEPDEVVGGEVIGDGDDEEGGGAGAGAREGRVRQRPEQVDHAPPLGEPRAPRRRRGGGEAAVVGGEGVVGVHRVDPEEEHLSPFGLAAIAGLS